MPTMINKVFEFSQLIDPFFKLTFLELCFFSISTLALIETGRTYPYR